MIDTGDIVHHGPSGEDWVVAFVRGDRLTACGWPESEARLADCELIEASPPARRVDLLKMMARASDPTDSRGHYARQRLQQIGETWEHGPMAIRIAACA